MSPVAATITQKVTDIEMILQAITFRTLFFIHNPGNMFALSVKLKADAITCVVSVITFGNCISRSAVRLDFPNIASRFRARIGYILVHVFPSRIIRYWDHTACNDISFTGA